MVDPAGRAELVALLAGLPARHRMAVVLVTHQEAEAAAADRVIHLAAGRMVDHLPDWSPIPPVALDRGVRGAVSQASGPLLRLNDVRHTYLSRTPWATEALFGVDLAVERGEGVLIVGGNGSGKSTLAWVIAGLIAPTAGTCVLDGKPTTAQVGRVALAFQHARLQLQRRTVSAEIESWGGPGTGSAGVGRALDAVGLDRMIAGRPIDELSGGEARRVVLAGILVSHPKLVVLDEPLAGLDPEGRRGIVELLVSLRRSGLTLIVISHDTEGLTTVCNRVVRLEAGRILDGSTPATTATTFEAAPAMDTVAIPDAGGVR
jgi:energy-coupling factor transport system ATP-binding protein